jgi:hypothetical protein
MPKFIITETVPCVQVWTYEVEAETESDALEQVVQGKADVIESTVDEHDYEQTEFNIEEAE